MMGQENYIGQENLLGQEKLQRKKKIAGQEIIAGHLNSLRQEADMVYTSLEAFSELMGPQNIVGQ